MAGSNDSNVPAGNDEHFNHPTDVALLGSDLYVTDYSNHTIRKVDAAGTTTTLAGSAGIAGARQQERRAGQLQPAGGAGGRRRQPVRRRLRQQRHPQDHARGGGHHLCISRVNFTPQGGGGVSVALASGARFSVEYRIHHMSDGVLTDYNPGANSSEVQVGISWIR